MSSTCAISASSPASSWQPRPGKPGGRAFDAFLKAYERGLLVRITGDIIALSPPLIVEKKQIDEMFGILGDVLKKVD